ncbi:MAG: hypothetical protein K1X74_00180 [Pirellulales bacterium]|nr:hypothetical protein [Pirellulales bacterium]
MDVECLMPRQGRRAEVLPALVAPLSHLPAAVSVTWYGDRPRGRSDEGTWLPLSRYRAEVGQGALPVYYLDGAWSDVRRIAAWAWQRPGILVVPSEESPLVGGWPGELPGDELPAALCEGGAVPPPGCGALAAALAQRSLATVVGDHRTQAFLHGCPRVVRIAPPETGLPEVDLSAELRRRFQLPISSYLFAAFGNYDTPQATAVVRAVAATLSERGYPVQLLLGGTAPSDPAATGAQAATIVTGQLSEVEYRTLLRLCDVVFLPLPTIDADGSSADAYRLADGVHADQVVVELCAQPDAQPNAAALGRLVSELEHLMQSPATRRRAPAQERAVVPPSFAAQLWNSLLLRAAATQAETASPALLPRVA